MEINFIYFLTKQTNKQNIILTTLSQTSSFVDSVDDNLFELHTLVDSLHHYSIVISFWGNVLGL